MFLGVLHTSIRGVGHYLPRSHTLQQAPHRYYYSLFLIKYSSLLCSPSLPGLYSLLGSPTTTGGRAALTLDNMEEPYSAGIRFTIMPPMKRHM